jgi:hypothetical protein
MADLEARVGAGYAIGRMVTAAEVAPLVTWLASPLSVAVTGDVIACGGGVKGPIFYQTDLLFRGPQGSRGVLTPSIHSAYASVVV